MKFFLKSSIFLVLLLSVQFLYAQDSLAPVKFRRNALKIGTSLTVSKYFLSYEHAFTKHISAGIMVSYALGNFTGYSGIIFTRYYVKEFNRRGFFLEIRGSYAHFNPYVYSAYYFDPPASAGHLSTRIYTGRHRADIDYWSVGVSGGYKIFCNERIFFEFMGGVHFGKATFGSDDLYFSRSGIGRIIQTAVVKDTFRNSGPDLPYHFMINVGVAF